MVAPSERLIMQEYAGQNVKFGTMVLPIEAAQQFQRLAGCEGADPNRVNDPQLRAQRLAKALHDAGSLQPQHQHWLIQG